MMWDLVLRGLVVGAIAAYLVFYGLRPGAAYPKWMLGVYDQPWLFLVLFAVIVRIAMWDLFAGVLAMLGFVAFVADLFVFGNAGIRTHAASADAESDIGSDEASEAADDAGMRGWAAFGALGADAGSALARIPVAPGIEPVYTLYPVFEDAYSGERLGGPAAF